MRFCTLFTVLPAFALAAPAPLLQPRPGAKVVPGKFIAVLKTDAVSALSTDAASNILGTEPDSTFQIGSLKGLSFGADPLKLAAIQNHASVSIRMIMMYHWQC